MKKLFITLFLVSTLGLVLFSCKEKEDPAPSKTPEQIAIENLAEESSLTWTIASGGSVTRDGNSETNIYQNFEITFSANANSKTYSTVSGGEIFDSAGNWNFVTGDVTKFTLAGTRPASGPEISYTRSTNDLILTFSIVAPGANINIPGAALAGNYRFSLKRKQ
jgi:hypothetical protein